MPVSQTQRNQVPTACSGIAGILEYWVGLSSPFIGFIFKTGPQACGHDTRWITALKPLGATMSDPEKAVRLHRFVDRWSSSRESDRFSHLTQTVRIYLLRHRRQYLV